MLVVAAIGFAVSGFAEDATATEAKNEKDKGIRISLGVAPGINEGEIGGFTGKLEDETGSQLEVLYARRHWTKSNPNFAGMWGAGLFLGGSSGKDGGDEADLTIFGGMGQGGIAYKIGDIIVIEAQPYFGLGAASVELTGFTDGSAPYFMYGIKGGLFAQLGKSFELGVEVGYQAFSSTVELEYLGYTEDLTLKGDGLHASLVAAIKF
jgi:hypothetical protein